MGNLYGYRCFIGDVGRKRQSLGRFLRLHVPAYASVVVNYSPL